MFNTNRVYIQLTSYDVVFVVMFLILKTRVFISPCEICAVWNQKTPNLICIISKILTIEFEWHQFLELPQLGTSSRAIHGGAYFSAIFGRKFNPTTVLRPSQPLACYWRVIFPALCHFSFVFEKYTVLKAAFQEDFFKNGQNGFLISVILHFFCNSCQRIDPCDHVRTVKMASSSILITLHRFFS